MVQKGKEPRLRKEGEEEHISMKSAHNCRTLRKNSHWEAAAQIILFATGCLCPNSLLELSSLEQEGVRI